MTKARWILVVVVAVAALAAVLYLISRGRPEMRRETDLIEVFDTAEKRSTMPIHQAFSITPVTIDGETKRCIFAAPTSRIIWQITPPPGAVLRTWIALQPEGWDKSTDGAVFRIGVSDGRSYEELLNRVVNPRTVKADRRWVPVTVDLSSYGGRQVNLIFNTNASLPGRGDDPSFDWAVWGDPVIYVQ